MLEGPRPSTTFRFALFVFCFDLLFIVSLGAVLIQDGQPIAYISCYLTDVEGRYAQIEKEMLSIVHACKKFHPYIFSKKVTVYSDNKPLAQKPLLATPMRLQRMMLNLQWYVVIVK